MFENIDRQMDDGQIEDRVICIIIIYHECEGGIEKSIPRIML